MKSNKGITLIALVITIILLLILAGISMGNIAGIKGNINTSKDIAKKSELTQVQQLVFEEYTKFKVTGTTVFFQGKKIKWSEANTSLQSIATKAGKTLTLKEANYDGIEDLSIEKYYYKLEAKDLKKIGFSNAEDTYIVNYETGEVFNITAEVTNEGEELYLNT